MRAADGLPRFSTGGYAGPGHADEFGVSGVGFGGDWASQRAELDQRDRRAVEALGDGWNVNRASLAFNKADPGFFESLGAGFKDFFGVGAPGGWAASPAVSAAITILSTLLTGGAGPLVSGAAGLAGALAHEVATGGQAHGVGIAGGVADMAYGLASGQKSFGKMVDRVAGRIEDMAFQGSLGVGARLAAGFGGEGGSSLANDNQKWSLADLGFGPEAMTAGFQRGVGGALGTLQDDWQRDYRDVQLTGARVMRGLKNGGRVRAGETFRVGEEGEEIVTVDAPGTVTPTRTAFADAGDIADNAEVVEELKALRGETAAMNANMERMYRLFEMRMDGPGGLPGMRAA